MMGLRLFLVLFQVAVLLCACNDDKKKSQKSLNSLFSEDPLTTDILDKVKADYVVEPDLKRMKEGALNGMLTSLDPYSLYLNPEAYDHLAETNEGEVTGIGVEVVFSDGAMRIVSPIDGGPSARAGLQPGDYITKVDGENVNSYYYGNALQKLHGKSGSKVDLTIERGDQDPFNVTIGRENFKVISVKSALNEGISYIRISYFNDKTADAIKKVMADLSKENNIRGIILDLRNNPGGVLEQAVSVSSLFLGEVPIVLVKGRDPQKNRVLKGAEKAHLDKIPMVVLINGGTASASEILAAILKENKRAILIGKRSLGKGSVQGVFPLKEGGAIKLTTSRFFTPKGVEIDRVGVSPDVNVESPPNLATLSLFSAPESVFTNQDAHVRRAIDMIKSLEVFKGK